MPLHFQLKNRQKLPMLKMQSNVNNEIVIYQSKDLSTKIDVKLVDETVWLTQAQIVELFSSSKTNISEHLKHIFESGELIENSTVRKFRTVRKEGNRTVSRELTYLFAFSKIEMDATDIIIN